MTSQRGPTCLQCWPGDVPVRRNAGYWEIWGKIANCSNCGFERPYHERPKRDDVITPSQKSKVEQLKYYFNGSRFSRDGKPDTEITRLEEKLQERTGLLWVSIETGNSIWSREGGCFSIGRRGGTKCTMAYSLESEEDMKHYRVMFKCQ